MAEIADTLRNLRQRRAWSQEQLADIAGISARTVQRLEQGHPASLETLKALATAFDVPVDRLREGLDPSTKEAIMTEQAVLPDAAGTQRSSHRHLLIYAVVIGGLAILNLIRSPEHLWVIYPALGWGIPLALRELSRHWRRPVSG